MPAAQRKNGGQRAEQGAEHIGLSIPGIALGAEKIIRPLSQRQRRPPFDQLIDGANRQRNAADHESEHFTPVNVAAAQQNLPRRQGQHQPWKKCPSLS